MHTDQQLMWIAEAEVYPEGMAFSVLMCGRQPAREGVESGPGTWRFGVQFSGGEKATVHGVGMLSSTRGMGGAAHTVGATAVRPGQPPPDPPAPPVLRALAGSGSRSEWRQQYWLWPLPPPGALLFACEWPDLQIEFTTTKVSTEPIRQAASRAKPKWPDQAPPEP